MQIPIKSKSHSNTEQQEYLFQMRKNFDPYIEMLKKQQRSDVNLFRKAFKNIASSRIHAQHLNDKREQIIITVHKRRKMQAKSEFKLPTLGQNDKTDRVKLKFPPEKIKKIFV